MLWQTHLLTGGFPPSATLLGFAFGATVFGYNFAAIEPLRLPAWLMGAGSALCYAQLPVVQQGATLFPALIWLLYSARFRLGLRRWPVLKPLAIALAWAWVTVWLPLPFHQWTGAGILFVGRAAFIFALALAYDLCDQPRDLQAGLPTLVLRLGPRRSHRLIHTALALGVFCAVLNGYLGIYSPSSALALACSLLFSGWAIPPLTALQAWGHWQKAAIDALMALQLGFVWWSVNFG
jgi:4-hydroxybenzoate polyprenyltransferase